MAINMKSTLRESLNINNMLEEWDGIFAYIANDQEWWRWNNKNIVKY